MKLFISYSRKNLDTVDILVNSLINSGFNVWIDRNEIPPKENWLEIIKMGIINCQLVLLILSKDSIKSEYVRFEINYAIKYNIKVFPIQIEQDIENIPPDWASLHIINWFEVNNVGHVLKALGDVEMFNKVVFIWEHVHRDIDITLLNFRSTKLTPYYILESKLRVVYQDNAETIENNEELIKSQISQSLESFGIHGLEIILLKLPPQHE